MPLVRKKDRLFGKSAVHCQTESRVHYFLYRYMKEKPFFCMGSSRKPEKIQRKTGHWLCSEKMRTSKPAKTKNKNRGSSLRKYIKKERMHEEVKALAHKR